MNLILFGAGKMLDEFLNYSGREHMLDKREIVGIIDNNCTIWGTLRGGYEVLSPEKLFSLKYDWIIITSSYIEEIKKQLLKMGVNEKKIYTSSEFCGCFYSLRAYNRKYAGMGKQSSGFDLDRMVIYTAMFGGYDNLHEPQNIDKNITYVCFTDDSTIKSNVWNIEKINVSAGDYRKKAREFKLLPHLYFKEYTTSIWVDAKFTIKNDMKKYVDMYGRDKCILVFPHFERNCVYDEADACIKSQRGNKEDILSQIEHYKIEGYPVKNGLYETGCVVRSHNNSTCVHLMDEWKREIDMYSLRDQISFPYICWKNGFTPDICDLNIYKNQWLYYVEHNRVY